MGAKMPIIRNTDVELAPAGIKHRVANRSNKPMGFPFFYPAAEVHIEIV